jgi:hypothetical protein
MLIRTPSDLGALIRDRRMKLGLDQKSLAGKVGVSRQWIVAVRDCRTGSVSHPAADRPSHPI